MNRRATSPKLPTRITIRVSGKLFTGHLSQLDELIQSAGECSLWPVLNLGQLEELDPAAVSYLIDGENLDFEIEACPASIREWIDRERERDAA